MKTERLHLMVTSGELAAIDDARFRARIPTRSEAIRQLVERGLRAFEQDAAANPHAREPAGIENEPRGDLSLHPETRNADRVCFPDGTLPALPPTPQGGQMSTESSIPAPDPEEAHRSEDARFAVAYRYLEGDVCDLHAAALVLDTVLEDATTPRRLKGEHYVELILTIDQETALTYAMCRLLADTREFKATYYRAFEAGEERAA